MNPGRKLYLLPFEYHQGTELLFKTVLGSGVRPQDILYLTPSPRKLRAAQVLFARIIGTRAFIPPLFRTPGQLAREICEWTSMCRFFPEELKPLLIRRILKQRNRDVTIGYARVIGNFIADIKRHIAPDEQHQIDRDLNQLLAGYEKPRQRALEAWITMQEYNRQLKERGWLDQEDVLTEAVARVQEFPDLPRVLILDSFVAPNRLEQQFLSALIETCPVTLASTWWSDCAAAERYCLAEQFINFINQHPGFVTEQLTVVSRPSEPPRIYRFPNPEQEVIGICREICARSPELQPAETYLVFPRLSVYAPLIDRIFAQYQIPYTIFPKTTLATSPPIVAVLELLRALNTDYERVATSAAFASPYFPGLLRLSTDRDLTGRNRAAVLLNTVSRRAGIIKGRNNWLNIAERVIQQDETGTGAEPDTALLYDLQTRVRQAVRLTESMLEPANTVKNQARRLKQFLEAVGFGSNLDPDSEWFEQLNADRKSLYDILDTLADFDAEFGEQHEPRAEFIRALTYLLGIGTKTPEKECGGITVVEMEESLGINPPTLFFAGLAESELPGTYHPDPLLPDSVRRQLRMPDIEWHRKWQKFHFWRVVFSSPTTPFLSFPESRDGKPLLLTPFIDWEPVKYTSPQVIYSEVEDQLYQGRLKRVTLDEMVRNVDFSNDPQIRNELSRRFGPEYCFHITVLESYRFCPYKFYLNHVLGLATPGEPVFEIDAQRWGVIAHQILARLYQHGPMDLKELPIRAQQIARQVLNEINLPEFWHRVTEMVLNNLFTELVPVESSIREQGFMPFRTETRLQAELENVRIKGRIDRIDRDVNDRLRIIDYKTGGTTVSTNQVINKHHLQLPAYCLLLRASPDFKRFTIDNMGIYSLRDLKVKWLADDKHNVDELVRVATDNLLEIVRLIRSGNFTPLEMNEQSCYNCEYKFTCGRKNAIAD
ncbi:MAG: PD-(D/E)XK nuclease family protein [candidate division WOR-3 bacterium]